MKESGKQVKLIESDCEIVSSGPAHTVDSIVNKSDWTPILNNVLEHFSFTLIKLARREV